MLLLLRVRVSSPKIASVSRVAQIHWFERCRYKSESLVSPRPVKFLTNRHFGLLSAVLSGVTCRIHGHDGWVRVLVPEHNAGVAVGEHAEHLLAKP